MKASSVYSIFPLCLCAGLAILQSACLWIEPDEPPAEIETWPLCECPNIVADSNFHFDAGTWPAPQDPNKSYDIDATCSVSFSSGSILHFTCPGTEGATHIVSILTNSPVAAKGVPASGSVHLRAQQVSMDGVYADDTRFEISELGVEGKLLLGGARISPNPDFSYQANNYGWFYPIMVSDSHQSVCPDTDMDPSIIREREWIEFGAVGAPSVMILDGQEEDIAKGAYHAIVGEAVYVERPDSHSIDPEAFIISRIQSFLIYSNTAAKP